MVIVIHANPTQPHQKQHARLFQQGFKRHGLKSTVTAELNIEADIHVISGPWYAKPYCLHYDNVIYLDRCYYKGNPDHVSVGWLDSTGGRTFLVGEGRQAPKIRECMGKKSLFLADYNGLTEYADIIRMHPDNKKYETTLSEDILKCNRATGYDTTALVIAALSGLDITCKGKTSILKQKNWLNLLPYADWHLDEIGSGELWDHLKLSRNQLASQ